MHDFNCLCNSIGILARLSDMLVSSLQVYHKTVLRKEELLANFFFCFFFFFNYQLFVSGKIPCPYPGRIWLEQRGLQRALYWHIEARVVLDLQELKKSVSIILH